MLSKIDTLVKEVNDFTPSSKEELELFRLSFLGKKGHLTSLFNSFKEVPNEQKKEFGLAINNLKTLVQTKISSLKLTFSEKKAGPKPDLFKPVKNTSNGSRHPISIVEQKIISIFTYNILFFTRVYYLFNCILNFNFRNNCSSICHVS